MVGRGRIVVAVAALLAGCALPSPATSQPTTPVPPLAVLTVPGQPPVEGAVGTYTWDDFASDGPWLAGAGPVLVLSDILAHVRLPAAIEVSQWVVLYAPLDGGTVDVDAAQLQSNGTSAEIAFPAPPAGTWSVQLDVRFTGHGRANYYWRFETAP